MKSVYLKPPAFMKMMREGLFAIITSLSAWSAE